MFDLVAVYEGVSLRLAPLRAELNSIGALVRAVPDQENTGINSAIGNIYFLVIKGKATPSDVIGAIIQEVNFVLRVVVEFPSHYGDKGVLYLTQRCISLLLGYQAPQAIYGLSLIEFNVYKGELWSIEVDFSLVAIIKETIVDELLPLLNTLIYQETLEGGGVKEFTHVIKDEINVY